MLQGKYTRKMVAAVLLTILMTNTFAPAAFALTSGPTQPEATSFEPIDTTDMVNMQTGDLVYNVPLMDVPGPEGSYPLALSYHAGIQPNMDASWVGLGWTLNPGAINRSVNGIPDDWLGIQNNSRYYWSGGTTSSYGVGVNIGIANSPFNVSFGLSVSKDTYKGFGVGFDAMVGEKGSPISLGVAKDPYSGVRMNGEITLDSRSGEQMSSSMGVTFSTNFKSLNTGTFASLGVHGNGLFQGSMATGGDKPSLSYGGHPATINGSKPAGIETSTKGINQDFPISEGLSIHLSFSKTRYWTDETSTTWAYGSLYPSTGLTPTVYDNYSLLEDPASLNIAAYPDPSVLQGGTLPDYDEYDVSAQGLSGNIRPYFFQGDLQQQPHKTPAGITYLSYFPGSVSGRPIQYRFINDFSNSFRQAYNMYSSTDLQQDITSPTSVPDPFDANPLFGNTNGATDYGNGNKTNNYGASITNGIPYMSLAGSRHVDMGLKIKPSSGIALGYNPGDYAKTGLVTGYSITNESGVTYHYGLPAYSFNEENYQEKIDRTGGLYFNRSVKKNGYAYCWYLTTVTGSDYVDRNNNGVADIGDWGYWVNFDYGKWSNHYEWRNPSEGFQRDDDNNFRNCSMGEREVYYLNAIRTRSHIALFEKGIRNDAKGESPAIFVKNKKDPNVTNPNNDTDYTYPDGVFDASSGQSLRLDRIYLLNAADANIISPSSGTTPSYIPANRSYPCTDCELSANVLDRTDVDAIGRAALESKSLRVIDFTYDYSLCANTKNSFNSLVPAGNNILTGKLTLNAVTLKGKGGVTSMPSMQFSYELPTAAIKTATGTVSATSFATSTPVFQVGDLLQAGGIFYGAITKFNPATNTYTLANSSLTAASGSMTQTLSTTKNPSYNKDAYDMWGMYKSNTDASVLSSNENLGRTTDVISSKAVDAWCLRGITTQLGDQIQLNYESDTYHQVAMGNTYSLVMQNIVVVPGSNNGTIQFKLANYGSSIDPGSIIQTGSVFPRVELLIDATWSGCSGCYTKATIPSVAMNITSTTTNPTDGSITYTGVLATPITYNGFLNKIWTGNLWVNQNTDYYGGGIRVASLSVRHTFDNTTSGVKYNYNNNGFSTGITTYLPSVLDAYDNVAANSNPSNLNYGTMASWIFYYQKALYQNANSLYPLARVLPPPGVMYEYVTVTNQFGNSDEPNVRNVIGSTQYQFEVFRNNMVGREQLASIDGPTSGAHPFQHARSWVLRQFTNCIGNIKRIIQYDDQGKRLTETDNHYLHDDLEGSNFHDFMTAYQARLAQYNYQGFIQERYSEIKRVTEDYYAIREGQPPPIFQNGTDFYDVSGTRATLTAKEEYPCIQTGQQVYNFVNGTVTGRSNLTFDFYSGAVTEKLQTDEYGNNFRTETVPAYQKYAAMGLKINTDNNLNMLTQTAETRVWKVDGLTASSNHLGLVSATVNTWSNIVPALDIDGSSHIQDGRSEGPNILNGNVWRPQYTIAWLSTRQTSDGLTSDFFDYNWSPQSLNDGRWTRTATASLYDVFSKELEAIDIKGNYAATHMNYGEKKVILTGGPAKYYEMAYSGAEDAALNQTNPGFIQAGAGTVSTAAGTAHTGAQSLLLNAGAKGFIYSVNMSNLTAGRNYTASVWVKAVSGSPGANLNLYYDINGGTAVASQVSSTTSAKTAGGWTLVNLSIPGGSIVAGSTLNVWCRNDGTGPAYVDDMRFQPLNASSSAFVYDPFSGELTHILDNNNLYIRFEYDAEGRLVRTFKEKLNTGSFAGGEFKTNQYQYNYSGVKHLSAAIVNQFFAKNNCTATQQPSGAFINLPQGAYTSYISQADADLQAQTYAQDQVNTQGTCTNLATISFSKNYSGTITANFLQNGSIVKTVTFPAANNTSVQYTIPTGTYVIQFSTSIPSNIMTYELYPATSVWNGSGTVTTPAINFTAGVNYSIYAELK